MAKCISCKNLAEIIDYMTKIPYDPQLYFCHASNTNSKIMLYADVSDDIPCENYKPRQRR